MSSRAEQIEEILTRSIDMVYPTRDAMKAALESGKQLRIYVGIDPTADYVHLGHSTNYLLLERLHKLGHKIVVLVGDFTAMIGDPTDKAAARVRLTHDDVQRNLATFKEQIGKILNFEDRINPIEFQFNSTWLSALNFEQVADIAANFTVQQMLERDMFHKRIAENKPLYVHEFFYPFMQGYDSVALEADVEIGGTDQTFNMLAGRILVKRYQDREKFVMTTTLLTNPVTGEKLMSKSKGTGIGLNESADQMFGKVMAMADEAIIQVFVDCTRLTMNEIASKEARLKGGENPKVLKLELAHEIVSMYHGVEAAEGAKIVWESTFSKKEISEDIIEEIKAVEGTSLADILVGNGILESKSVVRRLIEEGGVKNLDTDQKIVDSHFIVSETVTLKIGKKRFIRIIV